VLQGVLSSVLKNGRHEINYWSICSFVIKSAWFVQVRREWVRELAKRKKRPPPPPPTTLARLKFLTVNQRDWLSVAKRHRLGLKRLISYNLQILMLPRKTRTYASSLNLGLHPDPRSPVIFTGFPRCRRRWVCIHSLTLYVLVRCVVTSPKRFT
jgi:hypothetical protein